jgi:hypothetical protein
MEVVVLVIQNNSLSKVKQSIGIIFQSKVNNTSKWGLKDGYTLLGSKHFINPL